MNDQATGQETGREAGTAVAGRRGRVDRLLRVAGLAVAAALGAVTALYAVAVVPMYVGSTRLPLAPVIALVGNPLLVWFAVRATGARFAGIAPALSWCLVWFVAAVQTAEGDWLVLPNNWVAVATSLLGPVAFAVPIYRSVLLGLRSAGRAGNKLG